MPPIETSNDVFALEAAARQVARVGGWEAKRLGYALQVPQNNAVSIEIIATDAESLIDSR